MMKAFFRSILLLLVCAAGLGASAQEITFQATVNKNTASTGEPIKLTLTLTNAPMGSGITPPDMGGLVVVQGPFDQNSFSMANGRTSSSVMRTYYLQGVQPGDYTIGAATARVGGGTIRSAPITIHLVKGEGSGANSSLLNQAQKSDPNLFCTISLSKSKAYVGEQIIATYTLYSRYNSLQPGDYDLPKLDGFWAEEIDLGETTWERCRTTINGLRYNTAVIKKQVLFPQRPGKLRIAPMTLNYRVNVGFFNNGTPVTITSNAAEVNALDLPAGKPADFIGAVGDLKMDIKVPTTDVKANEAIDLTIRFTGRANLKLIDAPKLGFPIRLRIIRSEDRRQDLRERRWHERFARIPIPDHSTPRRRLFGGADHLQLLRPIHRAVPFTFQLSAAVQHRQGRWHGERPCRPEPHGGEAAAPGHPLHPHG